METIDDILDRTDEKILERGTIYYSDGHVRGLKETAEGRFKAGVSGSGGESYCVMVKTGKNGGVLDYSCDCPYDYGDVCKHLVAVFLAIKGGYSEGTGKEAAADIDIKKIISEAEREKLTGFLLKKAEDDRDFRSELMRSLGEIRDEEELSRIKENIREALGYIFL